MPKRVRANRKQAKYDAANDDDDDRGSGGGDGSRLGHVAHAAPRVADGHAGLQVVDHVGDEGDEDEENENDEENDDVALHGCVGLEFLGGGVADVVVEIGKWEWERCAMLTRRPFTRKEKETYLFKIVSSRGRSSQ